MSTQSPLESEAPTAEQSQADEHGIGSLRDLRGRLIGDRELRSRLPISQRTFQRFKREGRYDHLLAHPQPSNVTAYCGSLVQRWLDGAGGPGVSRSMKGAHHRRVR